MTSTTILSNQSHQDLRAPLLAQISKRIGERWMRLITLFSLDSSALYLAWQMTAIYDSTLNLPWYKQNNYPSLWSVIAVQISLIVAQGLYQAGDKRRDYFGISKTLTFSHLLLLAIAFFALPEYFVAKQTFILSWFLSISFTCTTRFGIDTAINYLRQQGTVRYPIYLICQSEERVKIASLLEKENRYQLQGWSDIKSLASDKTNWNATLENIYRQRVSEVFIGSWESIQHRTLLYWKLRNAGIALHILPTHLEAIEQNIELEMVGKIPTLKLVSPLITGSEFFIKRCFDFCFASAFILLASPIYLFIALLIKLDSPGPVFYKQTRTGLQGKQFKIWKFRTMSANADQLQKKVEVTHNWKDGVLFQMDNDPRITRVGKFLRHYSLDELPQLFNVVRGEMSLVGPRPVPNRDVEKFSEHHFMRYQVLPGMTGLWQVTRSCVSDFEIDKVVSLDLQYMESWSLGLDLQILLKTVGVVLKKKIA